jgi:hypothetical protein
MNKQTLSILRTTTPNFGSQYIFRIITSNLLRTEKQLHIQTMDVNQLAKTGVKKFVVKSTC